MNVFNVGDVVYTTKEYFTWDKNGCLYRLPVGHRLTIKQVLPDFNPEYRELVCIADKIKGVKLNWALAWSFLSLHVTHTPS